MEEALRDCAIAEMRFIILHPGKASSLVRLS